MADIYVWSGATGANNGTSWADAFVSLNSVGSTVAGGDIVRIASDHSETIAASPNIGPASLNTTAWSLISTNRTTGAAEVGASFATSASGTIGFIGFCHIFGVNIDSNGALRFGQDYDQTNMLVEQCVLRAANTGEGIAIGGNTNSRVGRFVFRDCQLWFNSANVRITPRSCGDITFEGGSVASGSASPTTLFLPSSASPVGRITVKGFDFSGFSSSFNFASGTQLVGTLAVSNCRLPASWSGSVLSGTPRAYARSELYNCDSADTNYRFILSDRFGTARSETVIKRTGGADDGTTGLSWRLATTANSSFPVAALQSCEIVQWVETVGSPITVTAEVVTDGVTLTDADCWIEVQALNVSGFPTGVNTSDRCAPLATAANQATSAAAWTTTGLSSPVTQKLGVTFTPQEKGFIHAVVKLAKPSTTVYVCPKLDVT